MQASSRQRIIATMSGTSLDGVDACLVELAFQNESISFELLESKSIDYSNSLSQSLKELSLDTPKPISEVLRLEQELTEVHLKLIQQFEKDYDFITLHGQTLYHKPPLSWQAIRPDTIVANLKKPCLYNLRSADLAHGGQGAPISPLADAYLFHNPKESRTIVNFGGFINLTHLPAGEFDLSKVQGFDLCICNQWLDRITQKRVSQPFDKNGDIASRGQLNEACAEKIYQHLTAQHQQGRSLGSNDDRLDLITELIESPISTEDLLKSSCFSLARMILHNSPKTDTYILAGGGCHNASLVHEVKHQSNVKVYLSDHFGMPFQMRESIEMALLGFLCYHKRPITLSQITHSTSDSFSSGHWVYP